MRYTNLRFAYLLPQGKGRQTDRPILRICRKQPNRRKHFGDISYTS